MLVRPNDILIKDSKTVTFAGKSVISLGRKIWNASQQNTEAENSCHKFEKYIATRFVNL